MLNWAAYLSSWDTLTVDELGNPTNGTSIRSPAGVEVAVYYNWLIVAHKAAWTSLAADPEPIVATVSEGELSYQDVYILACRGPQAGLYFTTWFTSTEGIRSTAGCAVNGFVDSRGVLSESYYGVLPASVLFLEEQIRVWAGLGRVPDVLRGLSLRQALRFNQGDRQVSRFAGAEVVPSLPGQAIMPVSLSFYLAQARAADQAKVEG